MIRFFRQIRRRLAQLRVLRGQFGDLVAKERKLLSLGALALAGEVICQLLVPIPMRYIVDGLLVPSGKLRFVPESFAESATHSDQMVFLGIVCAAVLINAGLLGFFAYLRTVWTATAGQRIVMKLRKQLYSHMHSLSLRFHHGNRLGDLLVRITGDIPMLRDILSGALIDMIGQLSMVAVMLGMLAYLDVRLALISVTVLIVTSLLSAIFSRRIIKVVKKQREQEGILAYRATETLSALTLVKSLGREDQVVRQFARQNRNSMRKGLKGTRLQASLGRWVELVFAAGLAVVLLFGVIRVLDGGMSAGILIQFLSYVKYLNKPLRRAARVAGQIGKAAACGGRIMEVLNIEPEEVDSEAAVPAPPLRGEIEYRGVSFHYDSSINLSDRPSSEDPDDDEDEDDRSIEVPLPHDDAISVDFSIGGMEKDDEDERDEAESRLSEVSSGATEEVVSVRRPALDGIDFRIEAGSVVGFVGRNGAGKSTVMNLLLRLYEPSEGEILFDGTPAKQFTIRSLRDQISIALQGTYLFGSTIRENLLFNAPDATDNEIDAAIALVGAEFLDELPQGRETELAEGGRNLSGGQRRKLALTGALLRKTPILVLDEPTSSIDLASRDDLLTSLPKAIEGRTTLLITHDPALLRDVERVIYLEDGRIVADGPHERHQATLPSYRALFPQTAEGEGAIR